MSATQVVVIGDNGQIVVPAEMRARRNWDAGTTLVLVETADGLLLTERSTVLRRIRERVAGAPLVDQLIADCRAQAAADAASE